MYFGEGGVELSYRRGVTLAPQGSFLPSCILVWGELSYWRGVTLASSQGNYLGYK